MYIVLKQVYVFLKRASRVYELIWKEYSLKVTNTAEGRESVRSRSRIIEIARSRMMRLPTPQPWCPSNHDQQTSFSLYDVHVSHIRYYDAHVSHIPYYDVHASNIRY